MPVTRNEAQMLATIAVACRPFGATHWDAPGVVAVLRKFADRALADVTMALMRAASDPLAKTPGVLTATGSSYWGERLTPQIAPRAPKPSEACMVCGKHREVCGHQREKRSERQADWAKDVRAKIRENRGDA